MGKLEQGFLQVYTGNGKGKTTAAIGLALRGAGAGLKTYIAQFMKEYPYNEVFSLKPLEPWITLEQFGNDEFVLKQKNPSKNDLKKAIKGLEKAKRNMLSGKYDIVILDEASVAIYFKLLKLEEVMDVLGAKPENVELIITGRYCPDEIIDKADLVTEMLEIKHYFNKGILARVGIES